MASFIAIAPFFEPGAPPPALPIPLAQTELETLAATPCKLLAQEEISHLHDTPRPDMPSAPTVNVRRHIPVPSMMPVSRRSGNCLKPVTKPPIPVRHKSPSTSSESSSQQSDADLKDSDSDTDDEQIPKPTGKAGRPGRGGYNLEESLAWDPKEYTKLKVGAYAIPRNVHSWLKIVIEIC